MSLASRTRAAVREEPFLYDALRAGVVNYTAATRYLDVEGDEEAVATALRRYAEELPPKEPTEADATVSMKSGVGTVAAGEAGDPLLSVGGRAFEADGGDQTAIVARGAVDAGALGAVLGRLATADVDVRAAGVADDALIVVVARRAGADAVRVVESALGDR